MEFNFSNTKSVVEVKVARGILFLDIAKVYYGNVDDLELKVSLLKEQDLRIRKFKLSRFLCSKQNSVQLIDFKKHINTRSWITITEPTLVRFSITNYIEHRTMVNCFLIDF